MKPIKQLRKEMDEVYLRPENYKFEKVNKLLRWANAVILKIEKDLKTIKHEM